MGYSNIVLISLLYVHNRDILFRSNFACLLLPWEPGVLHESTIYIHEIYTNHKILPL